MGLRFDGRRPSVTTASEAAAAEAERMLTRLFAESGDVLRPDDVTALRALLQLVADEAPAPQIVAALRVYYGDFERADRTPRGFLYVHIGLLCTLLAVADAA